MRIAGLFAPAGAFLLAAALFAGGAAAAEDDLPDLGEEVERMASEVALELQRVCPPASPAEQAAFDRCRRSLLRRFGAAAQPGAAAALGPPASGCRSGAQGHESHAVRARCVRRPVCLALH